MSAYGGVQRRLTTARRHLEGSWPQELVSRLNALDVVDSITLFGAALLLAVLPFVILLSSLADERIDDDVSRHIGLNGQGAHIIRGLFRTSPSHSTVPLVLGLIMAFAGTLTTVRSLQVIYERAFDQEHRGWRDLPRFAVWVALLLGLLVAEAALDAPLRTAVGPIVRAFLSLPWLIAFFWWTMHFLLAGRVPWRRLLRPALLTAVLWLGFALFSSVYFSSAIVSDNRLYGTIGVVFSLLTWLIAIGAVIILGAVWGAVWQARRGELTVAGDPGKRSSRGR